MNLFYHCIFPIIIKERIAELTPNIFMPDMANEFFNAWSTEMGMPHERLFCTWHVDQAWRKNLRKINNKDKKINVYKMLRVLLTET